MLDKHSKTNTKNKTNKKIKSGFNFILGAQNFSMHNLLFAQLLKQFQKFPGAGSNCNDSIEAYLSVSFKRFISHMHTNW